MGQHVSEISSKATKTLGFLRRNLAFAPRSTKEVAYKTLVRPKLEYSAPIWSPHSKLQISQIEKVQRTAARWTCRRWQNTSSVGEMLEWPSLEAQRDQSSLLLFHKIHCGAVSIEKDKYTRPKKKRRIQYSRLSSAQLCITQYYHLSRPDGPVPVFSPIYYCNSTTFISTAAKSIKLLTRYEKPVQLIIFSVFYNV